ncbi:hypothetical protein HanRHA438_Chr04g0153861 [Helianthus annuus]|nr:hypothetical protein HanRHA438_Chr04g0153861 [Helianthus annuus]
MWVRLCEQGLHKRTRWNFMSEPHNGPFERTIYIATRANQSSNGPNERTYDLNDPISESPIQTLYKLVFSHNSYPDLTI